MKRKSSLVIGGDRRMVILADMLSDKFESYIYRNTSAVPKTSKIINALSETVRTDIVVLPIPSFDKNGILNGTDDLSAEALFSSLPCSSIIFGAKLSDLHRHIAKEYGHKLFDYGENERFNMYNAIPTAEGAILITMESSENTVHNSHYVVIGYGRIGKLLSKNLKSLGGSVTVVSRSEKSLVLAECEGYNVVSMKEFCNSPVTCDICFNTVPTNILNDNQIKYWSCKKYIELASSPGGLSEDAKKSLNERYISALSLPGRYFPDTSGMIIYKTITYIMDSIGGLN
ncbi:MAG: NAD-binding protein [Clostridia bacterium]|nr:NAD-binding protein [Clostridia bacterium]